MYRRLQPCVPEAAGCNPMYCARLDVPVSGLCLVAKTRSAAMSLSRQFET